MDHSLRALGCAAVLAAVLGGCAATVSGEAYGPDLVSVGPGVQVIADYDEPIFYSDGYYWRSYGNAWYRSPSYAGGWVYATPPAPLLRIDRPYAYAHYRPAGWRGSPARPQPQPTAGWRGGYAAGPQPRPVAGGWRGAPAAAPPAVARPAAPARVGAAPRSARPVPQQQGRRAPDRGGWRR